MLAYTSAWVLAALNRFFERAAGAEARCLGCGDLDLLARLRVDTLALLALAHFERTEAGQRNLLATLERIGDNVERCVDDLLGLFLRNVRAIGYRFNEVGLLHYPHPPMIRLCEYPFHMQYTALVKPPS